MVAKKKAAKPAKTFTEKLTEKLVSLGISQRNANKLGPELKSVASFKTTDKLTAKIEQKLFKLGMATAKAEGLAKKLTPMVRAVIKARPVTITKTKTTVENEAMVQTINEVDNADLDKTAPRINGYRVRLDLPVLSYQGTQKPDQILRVLDGLTSTASYLVVAKRHDGFMAMRQLGKQEYRLKFYPNFEYWEMDAEKLTQLGATRGSYVKRDWYERMMVNPKAADQILERIAMANESLLGKAKRKLTGAVRSVVGMETLVKAFDLLGMRTKHYSQMTH